jgi:hypothetical protein
VNELPETTRPSREPRMTNKRSLGCAVVACTLFLLGFLPAASQAQVATHSLYQGQLTDAAGVPRTGPVNLRLQLYAAESGGAPLYSEDHTAVALDAQGMFAVALGGGSVPSGSYDAALLERPPIYLEVVVEPLGENVTLTPRQRLGAMPSARVAGEPVRFEDCGDGTVADHETGLLWERKNGPLFDFGIRCSDPNGQGCPDVHYSNNGYSWSSTGTEPDGEVFTDFLARLNGDPTVVAATAAEARGNPAEDPTTCFAHQCDWRLPTVAEQATLFTGVGVRREVREDGSERVICFDLLTSAHTPLDCVDPAFGAFHEGGRAALGWSSTTHPSGTHLAWLWDTRFPEGNAGGPKTNAISARAVRAGSCHRQQEQGG